MLMTSEDLALAAASARDTANSLALFPFVSPFISVQHIYEAAVIHLEDSFTLMLW